MGIYNKNMECLKKYRSNIFNKMGNSNLDATDNKVVNVFVETAINNETILMLKKGEEIYRMNSTYHPSHEAKIWAAQFDLKKLNNVILMYGLGNGTFARELISCMGEQDILFIYEPSQQVFSYALEVFDISDIISNPKTILAIEGINEFDFHNLLQNASSITNFSTQIKCFHPLYNILFPESHIKFWKEIKDTMVHTRISINTEILFGQRIILNGFRNIKNIKTSNLLEDFAGDFDRELPAIVVAAGPSLRLSIDELKKAKGKSYIFIVDRILDYALDNGLVPDFIVTIDPMKPVEQFTVRKDLVIPLLCEQVSNWEILDVHKGKKIYYGSNAYFTKMYRSAGKEPTSIITGASVATAAFSICVKLGFNKIVLVGQDLAYDGDMTHAGGIAEDDTDNDVMIEGIDGNPVRSRYDWYDFLVWFQDIIQLYPHIQVIDIKQKGAKIKGTTLMPLREVIDKYCIRETGLDKLLSDKKSTFDEVEFQKVKDYFKDSLKELNFIKKKSQEAIKLCDSQLKEYEKKQTDMRINSENMKKLISINKRIHSKTVYYMLDSFITSLTANEMAKMNYLSYNIKSDQADTYGKSKKIYEAIINGVDFTIPLLKEAMEQLEG